jgi:hypothetical protein
MLRANAQEKESALVSPIDIIARLASPPSSRRTRTGSVTRGVVARSLSRHLCENGLSV